MQLDDIRLGSQINDTTVGQSLSGPIRLLLSILRQFQGLVLFRYMYGMPTRRRWITAMLTTQRPALAYPSKTDVYSEHHTREVCFNALGGFCTSGMLVGRSGTLDKT
jgi:hypothetical protein